LDQASVDIEAPSGVTRASDSSAVPRVDPAELRRVPMLADLAGDDLAWIAAQSELVELPPGGVLFLPGDPAEWMFIALDGTLQAQREQLGPGSPQFVFRAGDIGGTIPFSRMTSFAGTGRALTRARLVRFPKARFSELLRRAPALTPRFVALLADRVRDATRRDAQFEKLSALGRLSAGVAHELTNPAVGASRAAAASLARLARRSEAAAAVMAAGMTPAMLESLDALRAEVAGRLAAAPPDDGTTTALGPIARADQEDSVARWLAAAGVPAPYEYAATFVDAGLDQTALARAVADVPSGARAAALVWLESLVCDQMLLTTVRQAAERVARLVDAVKSYTQMDRVHAIEEVDVRAGLESALAFTTLRARDRGIAVTLECAPAIPRVPGYPGDLNQAWGALLENALDAASALPAGTGRVTVRVAAEDGAVVVDVIDNGPGIPAELQDRVWEPFFTTKDVGRGTGLGLDIARRIVVDQHGGQISLSSTPGDTHFTVRLPRTTAGTFGS
jgi:signal transduction histidine kinase